MSNIYELKQHPRLQQLVRQVLPGYRKHRVIVIPCEQVQLSGGYWSGGSRYSYCQAALNGGGVRALAAPAAPVEFGGSAVPPYTIPQGHTVISTGTFCGKTATATMYIRQGDLSTVV
jgi:hypothetical protein